MLMMSYRWRSITTTFQTLTSKKVKQELEELEKKKSKDESSSTMKEKNSQDSSSEASQESLSSDEGKPQEVRWRGWYY